MGEPLHNPQSRTEKRGALTVSLDVKSILVFLGLVVPLVWVINAAVVIRQDVQVNSRRITAWEMETDSLKRRVAALERAKLLYCLDAQGRDSARSLLDADC